MAKYKITNIWSFYKNILQKMAMKNSSQTIFQSSTKKESMIISKMAKLFKEAIFHNAKK